MKSNKLLRFNQNRFDFLGVSWTYNSYSVCKISVLDFQVTIKHQLINYTNRRKLSEMQNFLHVELKRYKKIFMLRNISEISKSHHIYTRFYQSIYHHHTLFRNCFGETTSFAYKPAHFVVLFSKMKFSVGFLAAVSCAQNDTRHKRKFYTIE